MQIQTDKKQIQTDVFIRMHPFTSVCILFKK